MPPPEPPPVAYTNRRAETYYLHAGTTRTGKPRYFMAKKPGAGVLTAIPEGFEIVESINAVVSVRRTDSKTPEIDERDLGVVSAALGKHAHLRVYRAAIVKDAIVVFEPTDHVSADLAPNGPGAGRMLDAIARLHAMHIKQTRYTPVLKFVRHNDGYDVHRMTYRGDGGWSWSLASGRISALARRFIKVLGTPPFFELS